MLLGTDIFLMMYQILLATDLFSTMAEAEKTNPFAIIQIMLGTDFVPTMAEADRNQ